MLSPYTIDVGPSQADGRRAVMVHCHERPCFSTTHRGITRVCIARWPRRSQPTETAELSDLEGNEALRARRTEEAYQAVLEYGDPHGPSSPPPPADLDRAEREACLCDGGSVVGDKELHLCVFHREELADQYGRYTFVHPHTICTAYSLADSTALELVLHNITPTDISAASEGVFVRGNRQSTKSMRDGGPLEHEGVPYKPAADLWWMAGPLSLKPVYVAQPSCTPLRGASANVPPMTGSVIRRPSGDGGDRVEPPAPSPWNDDGAAAPKALSRVMSPVSFEASDARHHHDGEESGRLPSGPRQGRTAKDQFEFPLSRSASPTMGSPVLRTKVGLESKASPSSSSLTPPSGAATPFSSRTSYVTVESTVLTQISLFHPNSGGRRQASSLAVVRCGKEELGLAVTTPLYDLDCVLWQWWPHRVRLPRLASRNAALSVVASAHESLRQYIVFVYDSNLGCVWVLRTPEVHTGAGAFDMLFTLGCSDLPFIFPCLRVCHPAPIAVCNYPRPNCISVYDVYSLLQSPSPATVAMELDLEVYQAQHPLLFGQVRTTGGDSFHLPHVTAAAPAAAPTPITVSKGLPEYSVEEAARGKAPLYVDKTAEGCCIASSWASDVANGVAHPIRSIAYHYDDRLVFQYEWPSGTAEASGGAEDAHRLSAWCGRRNPRGEDRDGGEQDLSRRRRRCEGTVSYTLSCIGVLADEHPLLNFTLQALSAVLGPHCIAFLEYALFEDRWRRSCDASSARAVDSWQACVKLLRHAFGSRPSDLNAEVDSASELARASHLNGTSEAVDKALFTAPQNVAMTRNGEDVLFVDPCTITLQQVHRALLPNALERRRPYLYNPPSESEAYPDENHTHARGRPLVWTSRECGLALVALHLLFESCRAQESLWALLPDLAELNGDLSIMMGWPAYVEFYAAIGSAATGMIRSVSPSFPSSAPTKGSFAACLPVEVLRQRFDCLEMSKSGADSWFDASGDPLAATSPSSEAEFVCGVAPSLFYTLFALSIQNTTSPSTISKEAAVVGGAHYGTWPLLRDLPDAHPISIANRIVRLYQSIFCSAPPPAVVRPHGTRVDLSEASPVDTPWWERICNELLRQRISADVVLESLSIAVAYPLLEAITKGRAWAEPTWPQPLLELVGRRDRYAPTSSAALARSKGQQVVETAEENAVARQFRVALADDDGVSVRPDFRLTWRDSRLDVAQNLFNTVAPIPLSGFEDRPEELTGALELLSSRVRALPLGRGLLTMCTQSFKVQDSIPIPPLNLNGCTSDGIHIAHKASEDLMWPLFHNGCAAGLRFLPLPPFYATGAREAFGTLSSRVGSGAGPSGSSVMVEGPAAQSITKQWVMYQTKNIGNAASRAGLLLATGILGHLTVLQRTDIFYLLISRQEQYVWREATTMAVMLGLSCSFCGTSNEAVFRCLSVHVQSLNPSAEDIEVSLDVQTAALVSMGLLCQQSPSNSFLVEVLLVELSRMPTDEHCSKREGYVLGAGLGLGLLLLGTGHTHGVAHVEDRLLSIMSGAPRSSAVSTREGVEFFAETMSGGEAGHFLARALLAQEERDATYNVCASVYEGSCYNVFVSGPAAVMALGLTYLQTNDASMAAKIAPPDRRVAMQKVMPLMAYLRSMMASLICWDSIAVQRQWLYKQVPSSLLEITHTSVQRLATQQVNYLLMNLGFCIAGHSMALGLRYAGTMNVAARDIILAELHGFMSNEVGSTKKAIPTVQRTTGAYEACVLACASAVSLVMAGTGDLKVFAALQHLHRRLNVSYGSHMAISMSMGMLFLGSGRLTLANHISAVAALLIAFYPVWPKDAEDNVCHLQALRHLYGVAVVPRVMEAVNAVSHQPVSVPVKIILRKSKMNDGRSLEEEAPLAATTTASPRVEDAAVIVQAVTPCLYPPAELIDRVEVRGAQYYPLVFSSLSAEFSQSANVVFRVMPKAGGASVTVGAGLGDGTGSASMTPLESRVMGWLHRLFFQRNTTTAEALTIIESIKLMGDAQKPLLARVSANEALFTGDFGAGVAAAMTKRYAFLLRHGPRRVGAETDGPHHPLFQLIVMGSPLAEVLRSIAEHPHGTDVFPFDFTSLAGTVPDRARTAADSAQSPTASLDLQGVAQWMTEALYFHGLKQREVHHLRIEFAKLGNAAEAWEQGGVRQGGRSKSPSSLNRLKTLLRWQATTLLPLATLEQVWCCCTEE